MKRTRTIRIAMLVCILAFSSATPGFCKMLLNASMKTPNVFGGGSYVHKEQSASLKGISNASKIVVKFSDVAHTYAKIKITAQNRTLFETPANGEFQPFTSNLKIEKHGSQDYYYIWDVNDYKDVTDWVYIYIYIGTATGCPWLHYYKGTVEVYTQ